MRHRRLDRRFEGCEDWTEFAGETATRKILQGFGNIEDNLLHFPDGDVRAAALRSFDPNTGKWAIWWLDQRIPHSIDVPVIGGFEEGIGTFIANDTLDGIPIVVRFKWHKNIGGSPLWEQAFSKDDGATWETNWTMEFTRVQS
ncbi:MAG: hypothetical protein R2684_08535 [Pyrinomonadaceae bacterium]